MDDLLRDAAKVALRLGHAWVDDTHLLIALGERPSSASRMLASCGLGPIVVAAACRALTAEHTDPSKAGAQITPHLHETIGRAQGMALARGPREPSALDYLAATLFDPGGYLGVILRRRRAMPCLRRSLGDSGYRLPARRRAIGELVAPHLLPKLVQTLQAHPEVGRVRFQQDSRGRLRVWATREDLLHALIAEVKGGGAMTN